MALSEDQAINEKLEENNDKLLLDVATVYTFIKENELTKTLYTQTVTDYITQAIQEIEGPTVNNRPSKLDRLKKIEESLTNIRKALA